MTTVETLRPCPKCGEPVWDVAFGHKLNKCWGCGIAFDLYADDCDCGDPDCTGRIEERHSV